MRKCRNFTGDLFNFQPHDGHEEYNKLGMNLQKVNNEHDFEKSFLLVGDFYTAKEHTMKELGFDNSKEATMVFPNRSNKVLKMRIGMKRKQNMINPEKPKPGQTIEGVKMKKEVKDIIKIANRQRKKDVINVIRHNDFGHGYSKEGRLSLFPGR